MILGNPPYSGHSKNKGAWITGAIEAYKKVDDKPLGERNPKWLQDDYVKFIRFAQLKMDAVPEGIVGVITNHRWLDNPTFRGMRQSLMRSFDQIYVLDLHGYVKEERARRLEGRERLRHQAGRSHQHLCQATRHRAWRLARRPLGQAPGEIPGNGE